MVVNRIAGRVVLLMMVGAFVLFVVGPAQAFFEEEETNTVMSPILGFNPSLNLMAAVTNTNPLVGPCFTCPNTSPDAGGTTAGSLTDSMDGIIRLNSDANVGQEGRNPALQGQTGIPSGGNDASAFTVTVDTPGLDFLSAGTSVILPKPPTDLDGNAMVVGKAGVRMDFSTSFTFTPGAGSTSLQKVDQATFTGQQDGNSVQLVRFIDSIVSTAESTALNDSGVIATVNWDQEIREGGFVLSNNTGSFLYNSSDFPQAAAPTGPGQAAGVAPTCVGASGGC